MFGIPKKIIVAAIATPLLLISLALAYNYINSFAYITVSSSISGKISLYEAGFMDGASYKSSAPPVTIIEDEPLRVKKGGYIVEYKNDGYTTIEQPVELTEDQTIQLLPVKSVAVLSGTLEQEKDALHREITAKYPDILTLYTIDHEALYDNGEWYGARLSYKDDVSLQRDSIRLILRKEGSWKLQGAPYLTLSKVDYPDAPTLLLEDINKPTQADEQRYSGSVAPVSGYQTE